MGQGYEDHLVTQEAISLRLKRLYTNDIQRLYKVASSIVNVRQQDMDLSTYIGQIASLKEEFLTVMPLTTDVRDQRTQIDKFFMILTLLASVQILRPSAPSQTSSRGGRSGNRGRGQRPHCTYCNKLGHTRDRCYQLHGRPPRTAHATKSASVTSVAQTVMLLLVLPTHFLLDLGFQILALLITYLDQSTGKTIGIGLESQGLYHLTAPSTPAVCISTDAPLLIHSRLATLVYPSSRKWSLVFHLCRRLRDKLSARATKCIFLGYSRLQKGYRCYSSETHRYFLSADVTFFEDSPFFSTSESLPVSEVYPFPLSPHLMQCLLAHFRFIIAVIVSLFLLL
ncbi:hypothetical protein CK203_100568 [Vitis vinifera]|uniref:Retroviral polymerase SH3-like domain-containing protein n=1 Tax=Vitis vinifera TaxID=29760 RepID=A0A438CZ66_VITVI|nr:hypothetical protein CK203_100568 [Vitis vinifera]